MTMAADVTVSTGNLVIGTAGKGIDFAATSDASGMTSELLDDYEEGTWTIGVEFGGAASGVTINSGRNVGYYTKIGNVVHYSGYLQLSSKGSSTGGATITGLPFTVANNNGALAGFAIGFLDYSFADFPSAQVTPNTTVAHLYETTNAGTITTITDGNWGTSTQIIFSGTYRAA